MRNYALLRGNWQAAQTSRPLEAKPLGSVLQKTCSVPDSLILNGFQPDGAIRLLAITPSDGFDLGWPMNTSPSLNETARASVEKASSNPYNHPPKVAPDNNSEPLTRMARSLQIGFPVIAFKPKSAFLVLAMLAGLYGNAEAQTKKAKPKQTKPNTELAKLQEEFIKSTKEYKASLTKLLAIYEREVIKAEEKLKQAHLLFAQGLISKNDVAESERVVASAKDKVAETNRSMANADTQIATTLLEAKADSQIARTRVRAGSLTRTASYIRYAGGGGWSLSDAWKVQRFFNDSFKKQLPIAVFGQGAIHDRWRLDHRNSMDISLHPDGAEGQALLNFLRANGIPFLAFRSAIPGTATGPHIHIGRPSHRY